MSMYIFLFFFGTLINVILLVPLFRPLINFNEESCSHSFVFFCCSLFGCSSLLHDTYMSCRTLNMYSRWVRFTDQLCKNSLASGTFCCILQIFYCTLFMFDYKLIWAQRLKKMNKVHISRNVWTSIFPQIVDIRAIFRPIFFKFTFTTLFFKGLWKWIEIGLCSFKM